MTPFNVRDVFGVANGKLIAYVRTFLNTEFLMLKAEGACVYMAQSKVQSVIRIEFPSETAFIIAYSVTFWKVQFLICTLGIIVDDPSKKYNAP